MNIVLPDLEYLLSPGRSYMAAVHKVIDGDTVSLDVDVVDADVGFSVWCHIRIRIRARVRDLYCDETDGPNKEKGLAAKAHAESLLPPGTMVKIQTYKTATTDAKTFDRYVADISSVDDFDFAALMILHGFGKAAKIR